MRGIDKRKRTGTLRKLQPQCSDVRLAKEHDEKLKTSEEYKGFVFDWAGNAVCLQLFQKLAMFSTPSPSDRSVAHAAQMKLSQYAYGSSSEPPGGVQQTLPLGRMFGCGTDPVGPWLLSIMLGNLV